MMDNRRHSTCTVNLSYYIAMASNYYSIPLKYINSNYLIIKLMKKLHDADKPNSWISKIHRKRTGVLNNYTGGILILNLDVLESSWPHSLWKNCSAIWSKDNVVDSHNHSLDIYRITRSTAQWNQQDTCQLADKKWQNMIRNMFITLFTYAKCDFSHLLSQGLIWEKIISHTT